MESIDSVFRSQANCLQSYKATHPNDLVKKAMLIHCVSVIFLSGLSYLIPLVEKRLKKRENYAVINDKESNFNQIEDDLLEDLSLTKALDILWMFCGRDIYRMLVIERGWSSDDYQEWLSQMLVKNLLKRDST